MEVISSEIIPPVQDSAALTVFPDFLSSVPILFWRVSSHSE